MFTVFKSIALRFGWCERMYYVDDCEIVQWIEQISKHYEASYQRMSYDVSLFSYPNLYFSEIFLWVLLLPPSCFLLFFFVVVLYTLIIAGLVKNPIQMMYLVLNNKGQ
jgi:hypothetical protein